VQAKCKHCGHIQSNKAEQMLKHEESSFRLSNAETSTNELKQAAGNTINENDLSNSEIATANCHS